MAAKGTTVMRTKTIVTVLALWFFSLTTSPAMAADASGGKALYDKSCVGCHGADGKGNEKMMAILGVKDLSVVGKDTVKKSDGQLLKIIAEGAGKMPASKLTKDEQKQVLGYTRSLAK
jgi:mono/diheme cytochrome c family protein